MSAADNAQFLRLLSAKHRHLSLDALDCRRTITQEGNCSGKVMLAATHNKEADP
jgi:hypothetical protein